MDDIDLSFFDPFWIFVLIWSVGFFLLNLRLGRVWGQWSRYPASRKLNPTRYWSIQAINLAGVLISLVFLIL